MKDDLHDIRLLAGFEIEPESVSARLLERSQVSELAAALAADLARAVPGVEQCVLVAAGSLLEPAEMLRPGLAVWSALVDLARPAMREQQIASQVLAIGSHGGRLPDRRLMPADQAPQGRFVGLPLLLAVDPSNGPALETRLETELFDQGSLAPPARALLERFTGARSVHGQLLTVNDLLALQHVQLDAAGLSAFWSAIEQVLLTPEASIDFTLPAGLVARWDGPQQRMTVQFTVFDRFNGSPEHYPLWQRAFRTLTSLADAHGLHWLARFDPDLSLDADVQVLIHEAGPSQATDGLTEHSDPAVGLIAWTTVEQGRMRHFYPLTAMAVSHQSRHLRARFEQVQRPQGLQHAGNPPRLQPA